MRLFKSALLLLVTTVLAKSSTGDKVLVLLDPSLDSANYSIFFNGLESMSPRSIPHFASFTPPARTRV